MCHLAGQKRQYNVLLQNNLLGPGPVDQPLSLKENGHRTFLAEQVSDTPKKHVEFTSLIDYPEF